MYETIQRVPYRTEQRDALVDYRQRRQLYVKTDLRCFTRKIKIHKKFRKYKKIY